MAERTAKEKVWNRLCDLLRKAEQLTRVFKPRGNWYQQKFYYHHTRGRFRMDDSDWEEFDKIFDDLDRVFCRMDKLMNKAKAKAKGNYGK